MYKVLPLFKSHYSISRSILTLEKPTINTESYKEYPVSIFDLLIKNNLKQLILVEDSVSGIIEAAQNCEKNKIDLIFGLKIIICQSMEDKSEESLKTEAKYIVFIKNPKGYSDMIKLSSEGSTRGFYYRPRLDFLTLKKFWNEDNLKLAIPFYDSFLFLNTLESHSHVPNFSFTRPTMFVEDNDLPFDFIVKEKVENYAKENKLDVVDAQSIYYADKKDWLAFLAFRALSCRSNIEKPNLGHFGSDTFSFNRWLENERKP